MNLDELKFLSFLKESQAYSLVINTESEQIIYIHNSLAEELEYHPDDVINKKLNKIVPENIINLIFNKSGEHSFLIKDGKLVNRLNKPIPFNLFCNQSKDQKLLLIYAIKTTDERKVFLEKKQFDIFNSIIKISHNLLVIVDNKGQIISFNKELEELLEFTKEEIEGKDFWDFFIETDKKRAKKVFFEQLMCINEPLTFSSRVKTKTNKIFEVSWSYSIICNNNSIEYIIATGVNISAQEEVIAEADKYNEILETLLSVLRHDLQNDLVIVSGMIDVYLETENRDLLYRALGAIDRSFQLIQRITLLHETLSPTSGTQPINLKDVIEKIISSHLAESVEFTTNGDAEIEGDMLIIFALENIVSNAIKHGQANKISFNIEQDNSNVFLEIRNNGTKIDQSILDTIFDKGVSSGEKKGSGLGLFIVKKIMDRHNATINVTSNNDGEVVFRIVFPQKTQEEEKV